MISLILVILFIISISHMDGTSIFKSFIYYFFYSLIFSLFDVLGKKYMNVFFNSPYFLLFVVGTVNSTSLFIFDLFAYYFDKDISGVIIGFEKNITSVANIFEFLLDIT